MYGRLNVHELGADAIRPSFVDRHTGDRRDFIARHQRHASKIVKKGRTAMVEAAPYLLGRVADPRTLRVAWDYLKKHGGAAPGPDGMRYDDLMDSEVWSLCRCVGQAIRSGQYQLGKERVIHISKGPGRGTRPLVLQNIVDRVVQRAVVEIVQPFIDPLLGDRCLGYRPGKDRLHALAMAAKLFSTENRRVWIAADLRDAFQKVPRAFLLQICKKHLVADDLVAFIGHVISNSSTPGLRQGGPLSPLLLNLCLRSCLDLPWQRHHPNVPQIRVADDLLLPCCNLKEAKDGHDALATLARSAGMPLKGDQASDIRRLNPDEPAEWLGFRITRHRQSLVIDLGEKAWDRLQEDVVLAHEEPDAPLRVNAVIRGWLSQLGPCYSHMDREAACGRIESLAREQGFDEIPERAEVEWVWQRAFARWSRVRKMA